MHLPVSAFFKVPRVHAMNVAQRDLGRPLPRPKVRENAITAAEVQSWFKRPGRLADPEYEEIAVALNAMRWPGDLQQFFTFYPSDWSFPATGSELKPALALAPGDDLPVHKGVAQSVSVLEAALPTLIQVLSEHDAMCQAGDIEAVMALQSALGAAKPAIHRLWPARSRGRPQLRFDLWPSDHWRAASRKMRVLFARHLSSGDRPVSFERNSVAIHAILAALRRMKFDRTNGLTASTLSQHLTKNNR